MGRTKKLLVQLAPFTLQEWLWLMGFLLLPYASYLSLGVLFCLTMIAVYRRGSMILNRLWNQGFILLTVGLIISAAFAIQPGDAFLQLANFIPYFLFFGVLLTLGYGSTQGTHQRIKYLVTILGYLAQALILTSLPISLMAILEYCLMIPNIAAHVSDWAIFGWVFDWSYIEYGRRAHANMSHPNILSAYLVTILSLCLGLLWEQLQVKQPREPQTSSEPMGLLLPPWLISAITVCSLIGILCTGSRNGILIALCQLFLMGCLSRRNYSLVLAGLGFAIAIITSMMLFGVGGRQLTLELMTRDPRIGVWQLAIGLIQQRPLFGWGLGSFGTLYIPNSVPGYPHIHHAHNIWLYLASEVGLPLMVGFCFVIGHLYYGGVKVFLKGAISYRHRAILLSYLLAFGSCILFGFFDVALFDSRINVLNWLMLAGVSILANAPAQNDRLAQPD